MEVTSISVQNGLILGFFFIFCGLYFLSWIFRRPSKNLPPGPREWGTQWKLLKASWNSTLPKLASEWALKYKDIFFVHSFGVQLVFLNSAATTRKLLASDEYKFLVADRFPNAATRTAEMNGKDLVFSKFDAIMRKKRRLFFTVTGLYGDGVAKFENVVWGEIQRMLTDIDIRQGQDLDLTSILTRSLKNILYILVRGEGAVDPREPEILEEYDVACNRLAQPDVDFVLDNLPFLAQIPGRFRKAVARVKEAKIKADELLFHGPKRSHKPGQPRGITDLLLDLAKKPDYEWMDEDEEHIIAFLASLVIAANVTTRSSLTGVFLCLVNYPEVVRSIQGEIDRVIGSEQPKLEHKSRMPCTEAAILEGVRLISPAPLNGLRRASVDIDFEGMVIPKNSLIIINSWHLLHDENKWEDPWTFNPKRFQDSDGNLLPVDHPRRKDLIAFGAGARVCPGETFARSRMFLFITSILQRYDLLPPTSEKLTPADFNIHDETVQGLVRQTPPFKCRLVRRQKQQQ